MFEQLLGGVTSRNGTSLFMGCPGMFTQKCFKTGELFKKSKKHCLGNSWDNNNNNKEESTT
eukprot:338602-Amphidinium_carterae.1